MEAKGLIDVLTFSEKRRELLFLLMKSPRTFDEIKKYFDVRTPEIQPRIKELRDENMVDKSGELYTLTPLGEVIAMYYKSFFETTVAIDKNKEFWKTHELSSIPKEFLNRMKDLKDCNVIKAKDYNICASHVEFVKNIKSATRFKGATSVFNPIWIGLFTDLSSKGDTQIEIIITTEIYEGLKIEYPDKLHDLLKNSNVHMYIHDNLKIAFATTHGEYGDFFSLGLYNKSTQLYDNQNDLEGADEISRKWGEELFEYYKENAVKIEQLQEADIYSFYESSIEEIEL